MLPIHFRRLARPVNEDPFQLELSRVLGRYLGEGSETANTGFYPVDVREDADRFYIDAELPGFRKEEVSVTLENSVLSITAERKSDPNAGKGEPHIQERRFTRVARSFTLPTTVNESSVQATLEDGVLKLVLHKREEVKPRKIAVN